MRQEVIKHEVDKLLEVGFIKEIKYLEWLSNVVVVPKKKKRQVASVHGLYQFELCLPKRHFSLAPDRLNHGSKSRS